MNGETEAGVQIATLLMKFFQKKKRLSLNVRCYLFKLDVMYYDVSIFEIYFVHFRKLLCQLFEVDSYVYDFLSNC
jgi:hypothetical protein